jgi:hypothetical protein
MARSLDCAGKLHLGILMHETHQEFSHTAGRATDDDVNGHEIPLLGDVRITAKQKNAER